MNEIPGHKSPPYSENSRNDALFHYTSADGLIGILQNEEIWSTAYYCSNDVSELAAGKGTLTPEFLRVANKLIQDNDPLVQKFRGRGIGIMEYARAFEERITALAFHKLCAYITCFCKPTGKEDFLHGLLSQWRAYGADGGYALQFSRKKLLAALEKANEAQGLNYELQDVHYTVENPLKVELLSHTDSFIRAYKDYLEEMGAPLQELVTRQSMPNPIANLLGGPLESLLDYLVHTKNQHFGEERECRLSLIEAVTSGFEVLPMNYFNRNGLIIPYKKTPHTTFPLLDCVEWIVIGPNPRMGARFKSVTQMVQAAGLTINVRPSPIPFVRV